MAHSMRKEYDEHGVSGFYEKFGSTYRNKHTPEIRRVIKTFARRLPDDLKELVPFKVLDLACGSGEATLALVEARVSTLGCIEACDPFTKEAFLGACQKEAFSWSFEDVANGCLQDHDKEFHLCVCSFALHLLDDSKLYSCSYHLALACDYMLILTPHKRPEIRCDMGFELLFEFVEERIHVRLYKSNLR